MNRRAVPSLFLGLMLLAMCGSKHVANSEIVTKYQAAGGGDPDGATADQMGVWLSKKEQEGVRKELSPLSKARQDQNPPADWKNSDEGRVCTGVIEANFFAPVKIPHGSAAF
jgi:hypothetical protein